MTHDPIDDLSATLLSAARLGALLTEPQARAAVEILTATEDPGLAIDVLRSLSGCKFAFVLDEIERRMRDDADPRIRRACAFALLHDERPGRAAAATAELLQRPVTAPVDPPPQLIERLRKAGARFAGRVAEGLSEFVAKGDEGLRALAAAHREMLLALARRRRHTDGLLSEATLGGKAPAGAAGARSFELSVQVFPSGFRSEAVRSLVIPLTVVDLRFEPTGDAPPHFSGSLIVDGALTAGFTPAWLVCEVGGKVMAVVAVAAADRASGSEARRRREPLRLQIRAESGLPPIDTPIPIPKEEIRIEWYTARPLDRPLGPRD
jgi:hypothetical protein